MRREKIYFHSMESNCFKGQIYLVELYYLGMRVAGEYEKTISQFLIY